MHQQTLEMVEWLSATARLFGGVEQTSVTGGTQANTATVASAVEK